MRTDIQQRITSLVNNLEPRISGFVERMLSLGTTLTIGRLPGKWCREWPPLLGMLMGPVAFGLWWNSISAALFAAFGFFYVAGIYRTTNNVAVTLQELTRFVLENRAGNAPAAAEASDRSDEIRAQAIHRLRPWIADQTSLSEESVKVYCGILLDMLAAVRPELANKQTKGVTSTRRGAAFIGASPS